MTVTFRYRAIDPNGVDVSGAVEAADRVKAIAVLRGRSLTLVEVTEPKVAAGRIDRAGYGWSRSQNIGRKELAFIARQLASLLRAGCELDRALTILVGLLPRQASRDVMQQVHAELRAGKSLAEGLAASNRVFPNLFVTMVRAGEASGALDVALQRLAEILERQIQTRNRLVSALVYPTILLAATFASVLMIVTVVVPQFEPIFEQARQELPLLTRMIVKTSRISLDVLPFLLPALIVGGGLVAVALRRPAFRLKWHRMLLSLPVVGPIMLKVEAARFSHTMGALLNGGVPLATALPIARDSLTNLVLRRALDNVEGLVRDGVRFAIAIERQAVFPNLLAQLVSVGEEGARLGETLAEIGRIYDDESELTMQRIITIATPLATIGLGGIVALVLAAVLLAVLKVNDLAI